MTPVNLFSKNVNRKCMPKAIKPSHWISTHRSTNKKKYYSVSFRLPITVNYKINLYHFFLLLFKMFISLILVLSIFFHWETEWFTLWDYEIFIFLCLLIDWFASGGLYFKLTWRNNLIHHKKVYMKSGFEHNHTLIVLISIGIRISCEK